MVKQVVFKIDPKLKERAIKKARAEGLTYSDVLRVATEAYLDNAFEVGLTYNSKFVRDIKAALKEKSLKGDLDKLVRKR
jgi:antitoxin component of RelBE/YafQ-DinJ toxin-antitoxin module